MRNTVEELHLLGAPTLADYIDRIKESSADSGELDEAELIARWSKAAAHYRGLESAESGLAETAEIRALPAHLATLRQAVVDDPYFRRAFASLPVGFGMVELDKLVVYQQHVSLDHVARLAAVLGPEPSDETVFRLCLPTEHPLPEVRVAQSGPGKFVFCSALSDVRAYGPRLLAPEVLAQIGCDGPLAAGVGLLVGYGSAYLNVVRHRRRTVLGNGYHRAYALRAIGITHAPCIMQAISQPDELAFAGDSALTEDYEGLFNAPRPPLLKDFFDPALTMRTETTRTQKQIQVTIKVEVLRTPA